MNIFNYFPQTDEIVKPVKNSCKDIKINVMNKLNGFMNNGTIDMTEYTFLKDFIKKDGTICKTRKFHKLLLKINDEDFTGITKQLFPYLYDMVDNSGKIKIDDLISSIEKHNEDKMVFTQDQKNGIEELCNFLYDDNVKIFGIYGYAGTGKTTTITKLVHYLIFHKYINSVVFSAPTNKAVNVIKSKFRNDLEELVEKKLCIKYDQNTSFDSIIDKLKEININIDFMTIHKLLNYQNDYNIEGEKVFTKAGSSAIKNYDLVIIDECSMIPCQIVADIFEDAYKNNIQNDKIPKICFLGDPAQIPPVNEKISAIFAKNESDFDFKLFSQSSPNQETNLSNYSGLEGQLAKLTETRFQNFKNYIMGMKYVVLKHVMRSHDNNVVGLCNEVRSWVLEEIKAPMSYKFKGNKVHFYKCPKNSKGVKIKTYNDWVKKYIDYLQSNGDLQHGSNIILTWTNKQSDEYNNIIRKIIYGKEKLNKFEVGDILILTDFYNIKETQITDNDNKSKRFYTSEQIKVTKIDRVTKGIAEFTEQLPTKNNKIKNLHDIVEKYIRTIKIINKSTIRKYSSWKLHVQKLTEVVVKQHPETHILYVIDENSAEILKNDRVKASDEIKKLRDYYKSVHKENISTIENIIIRPLWREFNEKLVDTFANVSTAMSITVHKSQGSNFYNVFVDADDILKNNKIDEAKRAFYTALTRVSNELHILI